MQYYAGRSPLGIGARLSGTIPVVASRGDTTPIGTASLAPRSDRPYLYQIHLKEGGWLPDHWYLDTAGQFHPFDERAAMKHADAVRPYFTNAGPTSGPVKYLDGIGPFDVFNGPQEQLPVGTAKCIDRDDGNVAVWTLTVGGSEMPGRWAIIDRKVLMNRWEPRDVVRPTICSG